MANVVGATSTTEDVLSGIKLTGKRILSDPREGVRAYALDPNNAEALWKKSEELIEERF
jgi:hypothetical protein